MFFMYFNFLHFEDPEIIQAQNRRPNSINRKAHLKGAALFVVCNPCQSSPSLTILVPLWFIIISLVFFYLCKVLFSGFLEFRGNFVDGRNNSKYRDVAPLKLQNLSWVTLIGLLTSRPGSSAFRLGKIYILGLFQFLSMLRC